MDDAQSFVHEEANVNKIPRDLARKYAFDWRDEPLVRLRPGDSVDIETYDASTGVPLPEPGVGSQQGEPQAFFADTQLFLRLPQPGRERG